MGMKPRQDAARRRFSEAVRVSNRDMHELHMQRIRLLETFRSSCPHPRIVEELPDKDEGGDFGPYFCCRLCVRCGLTDATTKGPLWKRQADEGLSRSDYKVRSRMVYAEIGLVDGGR